MIEAVKLQNNLLRYNYLLNQSFRHLLNVNIRIICFTSQIIKEPYIVDHHIKRDRTEVIKIENVLYSIDSIETKAIKDQ